MGKKLSFSIALLIMIGCAKKNTGSQAQAVPITVPTTIPSAFMDSLWKPAPGPKAIGFGSNGTYYEDQMNSGSVQGSWVVRSIDSLIITRPFWVEKYRIIRCDDTLKLMNVGSFIASYTH